MSKRVETKAEVSLPEALRALMEDANTAQAYAPHYTSGLPKELRHLGPEPRYIRQFAGRSMTACLSTSSLPALFDKNGNLTRVPAAAPAGESVYMGAAVTAGSRVAQAGAHIIVCPDAAKPHAVGTGGAIALERIPVRFVNIEAASFGTVDVENEDDAPMVTLPVLSSEIDWTSQGVRAKSVRFEIPRSERRHIDPDDLCAQISFVLTLGLARAADEVLCSALSTAGLAPFTLAEAATQGLRFDELQALAGSEGIGAAVGADGILRVAGIHAELTPDMTGTVIGAWNRAAVAVKDDIVVLFERLDTSGKLAVTAWATMQALVPDSSKFWTVAT